MRMTRFPTGGGWAVGGLMLAAAGGLAVAQTAPLQTPPPAESPMAPADKIEPRMQAPNAPRDAPATGPIERRDLPPAQGPDGRPGTPRDLRPGTPPAAGETATPRPPAPTAPRVPEKP